MLRKMGTEALEKRKQFLFFGILIVGFIGLVAASPTIYAIVEPHITINMEPGQTTKPFVINDDQGTEVFSINPDGSFSAGNVVVLHFEQKGVITIQQGLSQTNLGELAVWQVVKDPGVADFRIIADLYISGQIRNTQGTGSADFGIFTSVDRINWNGEQSFPGGSSTFFTFETKTESFLSTDTEFIAFGLRNFGADTAGEVKDASGTIIAILPTGYSLERIL